MNREKILFVDENQYITDVYSFLLSKGGYCVVAARGGTKALEILNQESFDLVITDLTAKNSNGHTLLEEINDQYSHVPIIVLADNLSKVVREFSFSMGACALIEKPCGSELLLSCIRKSLRVKKENVTALNNYVSWS